MKALTVRQPWAWLIVHGGKDVENRSQRTHFRGRIAIHAGLQDDHEAMRDLPMRDPSGKPRIFEFGMVIGTVEIVGCHHANECVKVHPTNEHEDCNQYTYCSKWAQEDGWHWELADPQPLTCPFPAKGKLGLWNLSDEAAMA